MSKIRQHVCDAKMTCLLDERNQNFNRPLKRIITIKRVKIPLLFQIRRQLVGEDLVGPREHVRAQTEYSVLVIYLVM